MDMSIARAIGWVWTALAVTVVWQPRARAEEASLSWVRLPGAEDCVSAPELAAMVEQRIGRSVLQAPSRAEISIEGRVARDGESGWLAVIDVADRRGALLGRRELRLRDEPCSALDRPASLIISVLIDRDAAGPALIEGDGLSPDAQRLLAQLNLPSAMPDEVLALLVGQQEAAPASPRGVAGSSAAVAVAGGGGSPPVQSAAPAQKMVSVPEAEWRRMQRMAAADVAAASGTGTPAWPGYALLGLGAAATGLAVYATVRMGDVEDDPSFVRYGDAVYLANPTASDTCTEAENGFAYGVDPATLQSARDACNEGQTLEALFWVFAGTALASSALGGAWLLWIADDDEAAASRPASRGHVALQPVATPDAAGLRLRMRL
jgi:hypothetical protein